MDASITSPITYGVALLVMVAGRRRASGSLADAAARLANMANGAIAGTRPQR